MVLYQYFFNISLAKTFYNWCIENNVCILQKQRENKEDLILIFYKKNLKQKL